ncbi:MAG: fumarylacetoacetate hydrolase family protein [Bacteroidota bacterium]
MRLYHSKEGIVLEQEGRYKIAQSLNWDSFVNQDNLHEQAQHLWKALPPATQVLVYRDITLLPPIGKQEVWAAGVTYFKSRTARMEESEEEIGGPYDRVYNAERPELFFKSQPHRVVGHEKPVRIRKDSTWNVPEPELTLMINSNGNIVGYTLGNDMSSRSIEGENPLYLPQAKMYEGATALGPCLWVTPSLNMEECALQLSIVRDDHLAFAGNTSLGQMKRTPEELVSFLYREMDFPDGCMLMTGTGIVPENDFTLQSGDIIHIFMEQIGRLTNVVA